MDLVDVVLIFGKIVDLNWKFECFFYVQKIHLNFFSCRKFSPLYCIGNLNPVWHSNLSLNVDNLNNNMKKKQNLICKKETIFNLSFFRNK